MMTIALLAGALSAGAADAAEKLRIGYVDLRQVVVESKGGQQHKAEMEKAVKAKQEQISKEEEKLKALKEKFDKDQLAMSESQKQARQQELQEKFQALQKLANDAQGELRKKDMDYTNKSLGEVREIIGALAKEEDLALVFEKSELSVLYAEDGLDLTPKVLQKLDAKSARK
ncbi:MAG TPA: OmpH family outer membrane protein [Acidiferrobacterales bacterium]|jgi:outer membrane protein